MMPVAEIQKVERNIYHAKLVLLCTAGTKGTMSQGAL